MRIAAALLITGAALAADGSRIDAIFAPLVEGKSPGCAVLVRQSGSTVFERGYGVRDLRSMAPIRGDTDFRLASFTKQFTAMAAMLLVNDGKLRYDETLPEIFPGFPAYGRAITVRHLLTHTSGLPDYEDLMDGGRWSETRQIQDDEVLALLENQSAGRFAPGTSWAYSNSGYVLLGLTVAKASGMPFGEFLKRRIFAPLHMDRTLAFRQGKNTVPNRALGYSKGSQGFGETDQSSTSATLGDGGVYSNLDDLAKWDEALAQHTLLPESKMAPALTSVKLANGGPTVWPVGGDGEGKPGMPVEYGFGWFLDAYHGRQRMWHYGSTRGFSTAIERFPEERLTIVVLCNRTDLDAGKLALQVADLFR
ncbi:MAG TPA: serine hydrolase domain-containing protein [Bryobacteraceae bacterium]|jgi:CubicO group peptidase (beta-lactamase class C family)|nr:serine hydrolase domain-containing protein [Bryobacteraceae bacterium]